MKTKWLGVNEQTLEKYGAVSAQTALEMAHGIRNTTGSMYGISTTGIAGPGGGSSEKPVGLVYIAVVGEQTQRVETLPTSEIAALTRDAIRQETTLYALQMLWETVKAHTP